MLTISYVLGDQHYTVTGDHFRCVGRIRGWCGHRHRSLEAARRCAQRDRRYCARLHGYSDRHVELCAADGRVVSPPALWLDADE